MKDHYFVTALQFCTLSMKFKYCLCSGKLGDLLSSCVSNKGIYQNEMYMNSRLPTMRLFLWYQFLPERQK